MSIVYVDEYEPSSATLQIQDPIYKVSQDNEMIRVRRAGITPSAIYLVPVFIVGGLALAWWLWKKS